MSLICKPFVGWNCGTFKQCSLFEWPDMNLKSQGLKKTTVKIVLKKCKNTIQSTAPQHHRVIMIITRLWVKTTQNNVFIAVVFLYLTLIHIFVLNVILHCQVILIQHGLWWRCTDYPSEK